MGRIQQSAPRLVGTREVSKAVGVSQELLRKLVHEGRIPCYRLSERTMRFDLDEVHRFMKRPVEQQAQTEKKVS